MPTPTPITVAYGDGIGPEIMEATLRILDAAGAALAIETIDIGEKVYLAGNTSGIEEGAWESLLRTKVFLKAPITTPQGGGVKSLNVTVRKTLGLFANIRPTISYHPFVRTKHPKMDLIIVRENEEDLYAGIEHEQVSGVAQALKLISRAGSERVIRYAFEHAMRNNRKKVSCITKDNIMKITDGLFHRTFDEVAREYSSIAIEHYIVDIGMARLADTPEIFDVIVSENLYGDILSDVAAQISGSVGLGGSANIGEHCAMFEAIHGSAPPIAGQNIANPSGLLKASVMMLAHIGQGDVATKVENAWLKTIEDGVHTRDIYAEGKSTKAVGTREFADEVVARLGQTPSKLAEVHYPAHLKPIEIRLSVLPKRKKVVVGVDVFLDDPGRDPEALGAKLKQACTAKCELTIITNRGVKVWPHGNPETGLSDHWRACYMAKDRETGLSNLDVVEILKQVAQHGVEFVKMDTLCTFDGERAYSLAQGE
jgi:isocitrate dehydrogenase